MKIDRHAVRLDDCEVEVYCGGDVPSGPVVCAAHPAEGFGPSTVELLVEVTNSRVICVNPVPFDDGTLVSPLPLERLVDRIEGVRRSRGQGRWIFWGMSGGGWLAQLYARQYPEALAGIVIESACLCFRERLADPDCALSPFFLAWREQLAAKGLLDDDAYRGLHPADAMEWLEIPDLGHVLRRMNGPALLVSPTALTPGMKAMMSEFLRFDSRAWAGALGLPTLVIAGSSDPLLPVRHARAVHTAIAGSHFAEIPGAGHVPLAQHRPEVREAFRSFVEDHVDFGRHE